jgi:hypothetical protein
MKYVDNVSPKLSYWVIGVFHIITELEPSFFQWVFEGIYITIGHQLSKGECKELNLQHIFDYMNEQWSLIRTIEQKPIGPTSPR